MIRCVHSSRATIRSRNRSRSQQPEHFRWLATASAVAPLLSAPLLPPCPPTVCLSACVLCHQHTKPPSHAPAPFADGVVCFLFCTRFMSCGNWIVSGIEQWLLSPRPRPRPPSPENVVTQLMLFDVQRGPFLPSLLLVLLVICLCCGETCLSSSLLLSSPFGSCHKFTKVFLYAKACSRTRLLLLLVAAGDGQAAVIESIDAFATRIS